MKNSLIVFLCLISLYNTTAQNNLVKQWDYRYGGGGYEHADCKPIITNDNGFLIGCTSESDSSGDKSVNTIGCCDYWVAKLNHQGLIQWEKAYRGDKGDALFCLLPTNDKGFLLGGESSSGIGYDKSQPEWGLGDYWIIKIDSLGNILWDKDYGGLNTDWLQKVVNSSNSGYLLGGTTLSGIGGDKTQPSWGSYDIWLVKIDSIGNKIWDKRIGGSGFDKLRDMVATPDGGFILAANSSSGVSGDKTAADFGLSDYWVIKIDSLGNILWNKTYGGILWDDVYSITKTNDNAYTIGGISISDSGGVKTQNTKDTATNNWVYRGDYWIVKIDSIGNILWDKDYGGQGPENDFGNVFATYDNGFLLSGTSFSNISGDKTEDNINECQIWMLKIDIFGNVLWDKTLVTEIVKIPFQTGFCVQSFDSCYLAFVGTSAGVGGLKTQPNWDTLENTPDMWLIKYCDTTFNVSFVQFQNHQDEMMIYPNPNKGIFRIKTFMDNYNAKSIYIYTTAGNLIYKKETIIDNIVQVDLTKEARGIYFVKVIQQNNVMVGKVILE